MAKVLGVDYGSKQIGIAISDADGLLAFPREVIQAGKGDDGVEKVVAYAKEEKVSSLVLGLPKNMSGEETAQAEETREFGTKLEEAGLEVIYEDERLTTVLAEKNAGKREEADMLAAQLILQTYLERDKGEKKDKKKDKKEK